jgi:phosphate transport system protein
MTVRLHREVNQVKADLMKLCGNVEKQVEQAVLAVENRDPELARRVIETDDQIDVDEVRMEERLLVLLTLYQPVAIDLRYLVAILKINNDLERIGDLAVNIAKRVKFLCRNRFSIDFKSFDDMTEKSVSMLDKSLQALVNMNPDTAYSVCKADDEVDDLNRSMYDILKDKIRENPDQMNAYIDIMHVSRCLERIADLATNIAEDVIYICNGTIVRHRLGD